MPGRNLRVSVLILSLPLLGLPGGTPAASALAAPDAPGLAIPPAERVVLRSADAVAGPAVVRAIEADAQGARLEFVLPELLVQRLELDGRAFDILEIEGGGVAGREGEPMLPTFTRLIAIPDRAGVTCEVTAIETIELFGYRPFPMQPPEADRLAYDAQAYERAGYPPTNPVRLGEPAIARDLRVVALSFSPVRYDPTRDALEVATRIEVRVRFAGEDLRNAKMHRSRAAAPSFARLYRSLVPNHAGYGEMHAGGGSAAGRGGFGEGSRDEGAASLGSYVLICPNSAEVVAALQPLVQWRTRKGFDVRLATTAETGTSNNQIKAWLQTAYNTWEHPPEFITLVGDANGPVAIPSWGNSDHSYVQLEGGDLLADAHIGRISVESVDQLRLYVAKMVGYESTPYLVDPSWYPRACLVGDPGGCGTPCVQVMQWLKVRLREYGYAQIDTVFSSPFVGPMTTALNRGVTAFAYRGYIGMSGFSTGNIYALTNGWKMPYAVNVTCETGSFESTTSISEAWIRAGVPPNTPTGGIASVGTATAGTHSRYNNCVSYGIWRGIFYEDLFTFGESLTRGKYELWVDYGLWDGAADTWTRLNNLMGDAAGEMWTSVPRALAIGHPATLAVGTNSVSVTVTDQGAPCPGAHVCLWKGLETHAGGVTGADGTAELIVDARTSGEMLITVTAHDAQPYLAAIPVAQAGRFAAHAGHTIDDDASGTSAGNGDGAVNPTERIELPVQVRNYGSETLSGVTGTLTCADPYVTLADDEEIFGEILAGASAWSGDDFDILIAGGAPDGHVVRLGLDIRAGADAWHSAIELPVTAAAFAYDHVTLYGMGTQVEPGEAGEISVALRNVGGAAGSSVTGTLRSESPWLLVTDGAGGFGSIGVGATGENTGNRFAISAAQGAYPGHLAALSIALQFSGGARDTVAFVLRIGTAAADDPTGPDEYGYYAFDNTDTGYLDAPVYTWVEIAANHGGPGADVGLSDFGNNNDAVRVVDLPFPFQFYGQTFTRATICSNGWICMGATYVAHQLNWYIPAACAPDHLIAAMWDDLYQSGQDRVYHWFDANRHRYIVQWSRVLTAEGNAPQNFEIILHDPVHHPTPSGDGEIIFQYDTFNNTDHIQQYSTIGIENGDQTDGLLYGYYNTYNAGAATIASGRAIKFTPLNASPRGILTGTVGNATNGGTPVAGVAVTLSPHDLILTTGDEASSNMR